MRGERGGRSDVISRVTGPTVQRELQSVKQTRRHTDNSVKVQNKDTASDSRAYTIATSDGSDVRRRAGKYNDDRGEAKAKLDIKYSLKISDEAMALTIANPVKGSNSFNDVTFTHDTLCITYGQYEIHIRSL